MVKHIDSSIVEYNEDGSQTITTIEHYTPPTKKQQAAAFTGLGLVVFAPVIALGAAAAYETWLEKRAAKKNLTVVPD